MTWEEAVLWLRRQADQAELTRACFYDDPLLLAAERYRASSEWAAIRALLFSPPGSALDLGAGRGISSYALALDGWKTTALEPEPGSVVGCRAIRALVAESGTAIAVTRGWSEQLPFRSRSFDLVFARAVMHHARDLPSLCREVARVLKGGGMFIGAREHVVSSPRQLRSFLEAHPLHRHYHGESAHRLQDYLDALRAAGFRLRRVLNPFASDVNLFPDSQAALRQRLARKLRLPFFANLVPASALAALGALHRQPGRLYTFVAVRPHG